jgi:23S rRNA (pseudouridine1915-N3)-methyltransferase
MIKIICVGIIKKKYLIDAINEYLKELNNEVSIIEVPNSNIKDEGNLLLSKIKKDDYVIALSIDGNILDSIEFARKLENIETYYSKNIVFVIGGSDGLYENVRERADYKLSFSKLTFPHQLFRVMLCEQIFRARSILNNHPYHK